MQLRLKVVNAAFETPTVRKFELMDVHGTELPGFTAGAHIDVAVTSPNGIHEDRSYSLAGDPADRSRYLIAVLRKKESTGGSAFMHENVCVGDLLDTSRPKNSFALADSGIGHLLIAGGIGITPLLSMARVLAATRNKFELHYCARTPAAMPFRRDVESICGDCAHLYFTEGYPARRIKLGKLLEHPRSGWHVYVCGPPGMIDDVRRISREAKWPDEAIHSETFSLPLKDREDGAIEVVLARSGRTVIIPPDRTILDALIEVGVDVDYDCKRGECGACRTTVLEGEPLHRDYCLSEKEQRSNKVIQICVSWAKLSRLVLDL